MRPLILTNNPNRGASARTLCEVLERMPGHGVDPMVIVPEAGPLARWLEDRGLPYRVDPLAWPSATRPGPFLRSAWRVTRAARRHGCDLIHCNEHNVYPFASAIRPWLGVPATCYAMYRIDAGFAAWAFNGRRRPDAMMWTSQTQRRDSAAAVDPLVPPHRQHHVPFGLDVARFGVDREAGRRLRRRWRIAEDAVVVTGASALRPRKRVHEFIDAVARVARRDPRVVGVVAGGEVPGDEAYAASLAQQAAAAGLGGRLQMVGHLDAIEPVMLASDVFVSTSEYETFGMSVLEAMACGTPVAAYEGGSVAEVVGDAGRIVPNGDVDGLSEAIAALVRDAQARRALGVAARQRVATCFDSNRVVELWLEVFRGVLDTRQDMRYAA